MFTAKNLNNQKTKQNLYLVKDIHSNKIHMIIQKKQELQQTISQKIIKTILKHLDKDIFQQIKIMQVDVQ